MTRSLTNTFSTPKTIFVILSLIFVFFSCKKFVEIPPPTGQLVSENLFASDVTATSALTGIYSRMISSGGFASGGTVSIPVLTGLSADELVNYAVDPWQIEFYTNNLSINNSLLQSSLWTEPFQYIYTANACIEGINASSSISSPVRNQLLGESKFIRGFCYFYLVNLFGEVPVFTTSSYVNNASAKRDSISVVYGQIISDLKDAESLLTNDYSFSGGERIRPNKSAAQALLARVFLYQKDWSDADLYASKVIDKADIFKLEPNLDSVFLSGGMEAIWQLKPNQPGFNTNDANTFIILDQPTIVSVSQQLINVFEENDNRPIHWLDSIQVSSATYYYPFKYKIPHQAGSTIISEYSVVLRLAEQYLIRSEARAELNNTLGSISDLNMIRHRAGLGDTQTQTKEGILNAILQERRVELFSEWGHRWLDLKRTQTIDSVMTIGAVLKGSEWKTNQQLYPIPQPDRQADPNLSQNPGY